MRRSAFTLLAALTVLPLASTALAADGDCRLIRGAQTPDDTTDDVSVCRQDNWIHRATAPVGNLAALGHDAFPSWNTTKPTAATTSGSGGAYVANSAFHQLVGAQDPRGSAVFQGTYTGVLDTLAIDLYAIAPAATAELNIELKLGGEPVYAASQEVSLISAGNFQQYRFVLTNMYAAMESLSLANTPTTAHTIQLAVNGTFAINDAGAFAYDAQDVPSGLIFNLESNKMSGYTKIDASGLS